MKKTLLIYIYILFAISVFSQNSIVFKTLTEYNSVMRHINAQKNGDIPDNHYQFILKQNLPAVGEQTINYDIYFSLDDSYDYDDFYQQNINYAEKNYNISDKKFHEEYLYQNDTLIYYMYKENFEGLKEIRMYFSNGKIVLLSETTFDKDNYDNIISQKDYKKSNLPDDYNEIVELAVENSKFIVNIFKKFKVY